MRSLEEIIAANKRPEPMTPIRACQVATKLLRDIDTQTPTAKGTYPIHLRGEEVAAIEVLRRVAASAITSGNPARARGPRP